MKEEAMQLREDFLPRDAIHPIDFAELFAKRNAWEFDRMADDQIAMMVEGQWRHYALTLVWSPSDEMLRVLCTFELAAPQDRLGALYETLNRCNDQLTAGAFSYWPAQGLMAWRYGLVLAGGQTAAPEQMSHLIIEAIEASERFYPAFQLVGSTAHTPSEAMERAILDTAHGCA